MPLALFMRHGAYNQPEGVPSAHLPYGLTEDGRGHAREGAERLWELAQTREVQIAPVIKSSHLPRAEQTADIVAEVLAEKSGQRFKVRTHSTLAERSVGSFANLHVAEIERLLVEEYRLPPPPSGWKRSPDYKLPGPGAESLRQAGTRVLTHVEQHITAAPEIQVFVGHGGAFRHAAVQMGVLSLDEAERLSMHYGGFVLFSKHERTWKQVDGEFKQRFSKAID